VIRLFGPAFNNYVFVQVGVIDAGNFKGASEIDNLKKHALAELDRYVQFMKMRGIFADSYYALGIDVVDEILRLVPQIRAKYPDSVIFGGQLVFPQGSFLSRFLHNYIVFEVQRRLYRHGIPVVLLPMRL